MSHDQLPNQREQLTLGQLISELKRVKEQQTDTHGDQATVFYDFNRFTPTTGDSYRGYYEQFALGVSETHAFPGANLDELILHLEKECLGQVFHGWKGGEYVMKTDTPVWIANRGETTDVVPVGVRDLGYQIIIDTQHHEN